MGVLENKIALVTGGGSGIGLAIAKAYTKEGAKVMISDIDTKRGLATVQQLLLMGGEAHFMKADIAQPDDVKALIKQTTKIYGRLDIACNNAGIGGELNLTGNYRIDQWRKVLSINLDGVFFCCKYELAQMIKNGGGTIINIASIHGMVAAPFSSAYTTAKHAVIGLTKNIAVEYAQNNIRCNAICPAYIETPLIDTPSQNIRNSLIAKHPMRRLGKPEEVAEFCVFLSSDKASFMTGGAYLIDGGYTAI
ncbi:glucose 1-dehydrogenase [Utexia brackfieldae]|uniref:SDR family NAD(P)-dependent oxidoreductase n=1 Tax=Utexia brackfieldae TaxID=3074108 RepID=UPI00370DBA08